jgi:hypothetical protein
MWAAHQRSARGVRQGSRQTGQSPTKPGARIVSTWGQRERWRRAALAYYYRLMETEAGRKRLAAYKRGRRWAIRHGLWQTNPQSKP